MAGRGKTTSLTQEQLQTLGIGKDLPVQTAPPPTFPPLISKPVTSQETTAAQNYQILWREDFLNHMRDSPYFLTPKISSHHCTGSILQPDEWTATTVDSSKTKLQPEFNWSLMPLELHQNNRKRRLPGQKTGAKKSKKENLEDRLKVLEEKERTDNDKQTKVNDDDSEKGDDDLDDEENEELAADEEMDDENDYGNSYFDNGEAYNEEDDNLDDGPIY